MIKQIINKAIDSPLSLVSLAILLYKSPNPLPFSCKMIVFGSNSNLCVNSYVKENINLNINYHLRFNITTNGNTDINYYMNANINSDKNLMMSYIIDSV